ncbi:thioredoxin family protein [Butyricimonas synergistica]|uniref:thioredoxin family protein n=1 Tax=Butyricimonas synergistica TaxID=544644 RepID=UPI0003755393|nr:thioredoxin family protein [Butyricimonas synergistica]
MRRFVCFVIFFTICVAVKGQEGVNFEILSFDEALAKAREENKLLFVDCYTTWCGPCKLMSEKVFSQKKVGEFFNPRFVSVKFDMEKEEGKKFARNYDVASYPTFFLIRPDGTLLHKISGAYEVDEFIRLVKEGIEGTESLGSWEVKYRTGNRDKAFLYEYLQLLNECGERSKLPVVADELLKVASDEEKISQEYWFIFANSQLSPSDSKAFQFLRNKRERFYATIGREKVDKRLGEDLCNEILAIMGGEIINVGIKRLKAVEKEIKKMKLLNECHLLAALKIAEAVGSDDIDKLLDVCEKEMPILQDDSQLAVWVVFRLAGPFCQYQDCPLASATPAQKARWEKIIQLERV